MVLEIWLFFGFGDVGRAAVVGEDDGVFFAMMIEEGDVELVGEGVDNGSADAKTGEGAGARHESDFGEIGPGFAVFGEFVSDEAEELFGEVAVGMPLVGVVVEFEDGGGGAGVEVEFHAMGSSLADGLETLDFVEVVSDF